MREDQSCFFLKICFGLFEFFFHRFQFACFLGERARCPLETRVLFWETRALSLGNTRVVIVNTRVSQGNVRVPLENGHVSQGNESQGNESQGPDPDDTRTFSRTFLNPRNVDRSHLLTCDNTPH